MKYYLIVLLASLATLGQAQHYLYIKKKGEVPPERLEKGDKLSLKTAENNSWIKGKITMVSARSVQINNVAYPFKQITHWRTYNSLVRVLGQSLVGAAALFTGVVVVNRLVNNDNPVITKGQLFVGGGLLAGGTLLNFLGRKTYSTAKGWYLEVIDVGSVE